jgi:hypothetical protein
VALNTLWKRIELKTIKNWLVFLYKHCNNIFLIP